MKSSFEVRPWHFSIPAIGYEQDVTLPHTWNITDQVMHYRGEAVYETSLPIGEECRNKRVFLCFGAAFHSAAVYVNESLAGSHTRSGYTPFRIEITPFIRFGQDNQIKVIVSNAPNSQMLPFEKEFDWADDGGLIRQVTVEISDQDGFSALCVSYRLNKMDHATCNGQLFVHAAFWDGKCREAVITVTDAQTGKTLFKEARCLGQETAVLPFTGLNLWDVGSPHLYRVSVTTSNDTATQRIGLRRVEIKDDIITLNGKQVFLKGCEWMPGSNPDYGMAEPIACSIKFLAQLKNSGCVFTRFHWQQDDAIYDWCDENGLLVQEEIPYWGSPKEATALQLDIAKQHASEMVLSHRHHPSIICWGVGNELNGTDERTIAYVDQMYAFLKSLDDSRFVNYVSDTLGKPENEQKDDATLHGDIPMWNDYLGLWQPCSDIASRIKKTAAKCQKRPLIISEFGLCEPAFDGGDERRAQILTQRVAIYHSIENIAGYVWFSLNDYRTQYGECGEGKFRKRIHGSTDLYGKEKPFYQVLCRM